MTKDEIKAIVTRNGYSIIEEKRTGNDLGTMLRLNNGCIINCWDSKYYSMHFVVHSCGNISNYCYSYTKAKQ